MWEIENHSPNYSCGFVDENSSIANVNNFQSYPFHIGLQRKKNSSPHKTQIYWITDLYLITIFIHKRISMKEHLRQRGDMCWRMLLNPAHLTSRRDLRREKRWKKRTIINARIVTQMWKWSACFASILFTFNVFVECMLPFLAISFDGMRDSTLLWKLLIFSVESAIHWPAFMCDSL